MTDEELLLLEQITYLDKEVYSAAGLSKKNIKIREDKTVGELLKDFDDNALNKLSTYDCNDIDYTGYNGVGPSYGLELGGSISSGKEWADIIRTIQNNKELSSLKVKSTYETTTTKGEEVTLGICYTNPSDKDSAIVTYKGTSGYFEWVDDVKGIITSHTVSQNEALDFIKSIDSKYTDITVVGHSKGANKAMFVTIADDSDRIKRCVAFDGQGFSYDFFREYKNIIPKRADRITNFSLEEDFVHVLMLQIPGSTQRYCKGYDVLNFAENHSPSAFFVRDKDGMILDKNGKPTFNITDKESEKVAWIRDFVQYIMDHSTKEEMIAIDETLGPFLGYMLGEESAGKAFLTIPADISKWQLIIGKYQDYKRYKELPAYQYSFTEVKEFVSPEESIIRDYTPLFENKLISLYQEIHENEFFDFKNYMWNFPYEKFIENISADDEAYELYRLNEKMVEHDEDDVKVIRDIFEEAKRIDKDYGESVSGTVNEIRALTAKFRKEFGLD